DRQEIPSTILADTSPVARTALVRLWKTTARTRPPTAVIALSAAALREATPDALRAQAQLLRGKLNVLSRVVNEPIKARIVLTHMDQVEGYTAFSDFIEKQEIPHQIKIDQNAPGMGLAEC